MAIAGRGSGVILCRSAPLPVIFYQGRHTSFGYPIWSQPTGAQDAYNTGDIISHNGKLYRSKVDGNLWAPDAYPDGWEVVIVAAGADLLISLVPAELPMPDLPAAYTGLVCPVVLDRLGKLD